MFMALDKYVWIYWFSSSRKLCSPLFIKTNGLRSSTTSNAPRFLQSQELQSHQMSEMVASFVAGCSFVTIILLGVTWEGRKLQPAERSTIYKPSNWWFWRGFASGKHTKSYSKLTFIVDLPIKHCDFHWFSIVNIS